MKVVFQALLEGEHVGYDGNGNLLVLVEHKLSPELFAVAQEDVVAQVTEEEA